MTINELKAMNETERILWIANAKAKDLGLVLKNEGVKGISKMKKAEKLAMIVNLVVETNVTDEEIDKIMEDTKRLNEEINARQSYEEKIEGTLYARWKAKEITWEEFKQTIINNNIAIPINVADEEDTKDVLNRKYDMDSMYEHYVFESNTCYYSVLNKDFEWRNVFRNDGKHKWKNWEEKQMYERNTVDNGLLQLAFDYDEDGELTLLAYKNHELLGHYRYGDDNIDGIKKLVAYDDKLSDDYLEIYTQLLELLDKQYEQYDKILKADRMLRKKFNFIKCRYKKFSSFANENPKRRY